MLTSVNTYKMYTNTHQVKHIQVWYESAHDKGYNRIFWSLRSACRIALSMINICMLVKESIMRIMWESMDWSDCKLGTHMSIQNLLNMTVSASFIHIVSWMHVERHVVKVLLDYFVTTMGPNLHGQNGPKCLGAETSMGHHSLSTQFLCVP